MTYLQSLKAKLRAIQAAEADCITESGWIRTDCRYRFQLLVEEARAVHDQIVAIETQQMCDRDDQSINHA